MGNEMRERKHWEEEDKKRCRLCGGGEVETWEHVWERCRKWNDREESWQEAVGWVLSENGEGEKWMRELERERAREEEGANRKDKRGREKEEEIVEKSE